MKKKDIKFSANPPPDLKQNLPGRSKKYIELCATVDPSLIKKGIDDLFVLGINKEDLSYLAHVYALYSHFINEKLKKENSKHRPWRETSKNLH